MHITDIDLVDLECHKMTFKTVVAECRILLETKWVFKDDSKLFVGQIILCKLTVNPQIWDIGESSLELEYYVDLQGNDFTLGGLQRHSFTLMVNLRLMYRKVVA